MDIKGDKEMSILERQIVTMKERIAIMEHFKNGGQVEYYCYRLEKWQVTTRPDWDWNSIKYRIKEQKKTVTIEKWLIGKYDNPNYLWAVEGTKEHFKDIEPDIYTKVKLLKTYEVEI